MDHLSDLKNKLERNKDNRNTAVERYHEADYALSEKEDKLQRKVASLLEKEKMEMASYREVIKGSMDRLNHQQLTNNEYLSELNHNLTDMSDLKAIYETKREIMEQNHQEFVRSLESEANRLQGKIKSRKYELKKIEEEYNELSLRKETKKQADKIIVIGLVVFVAVVLGSWLGLGFVDFLRSIGQGFKGLFTI